MDIKQFLQSQGQEAMQKPESLDTKIDQSIQQRELAKIRSLFYN
jgi:hypothetical protein